MNHVHNRMLLLFGVLLLCGSTALAGSTALTPQLENIRAQGFNALYNMNYDLAKMNFESMTRIAPQHPAGYIYQACTIWLNYLFKLRRLQTSLYNRNDSFFTSKTKELDPVVDKQFTEIMAKAMRLCEEKLKKDKNDIYAMYYLGVAKGAWAGYETTIRRSFLPSLKAGSAAVELHRNVLKRDPHFIDAYVSLGMYDYVTGSLPLAVKIVAFLGGVRGSKKDGIAKLEKVVREGHYARVEAQVILVLLYDREKRLGDSLNLLTELSANFPHNYVFRLEKGRTLARLHRTEESLSVFEGLLKDPAAMKYMPDLIQYQYALALADSKQWQKAYFHFVAAASERKAPESLVTMARLEAGKCLDAEGNHDLAKAEYQTVLRRDEAFDSHDKARQYLKKPFTPVERNVN